MLWKTLCTLLIFGLGAVLHAQPAESPSISGLRDRLTEEGGTGQIALRLQLADALLAEGRYELAEDYADEALELAEDENRVPYIAKALHYRGKARLRLSREKRAMRDLEKSLTLLPRDKELGLRRENAILLLRIARLRGREKDVEFWQQELALLNNRMNAASKRATLDAGTPELDEEALARIKSTTAELNATIEDLSEERALLQRTVNDQAAAISNMSKEQMRQELLLAQQKSLVDSLSIRGLRDSLALSEQNLLLEQRNQQRNLFLGLAGVALIIALGLLSRFLAIRSHNRVLEEKNKIIERERERSENLLLNILPKVIADELKQRGSAQAREYETASVLFADFEGFSKKSKSMSPEELINDLDYCFKAFDEIATRYGLEKIKTIGDSYMCAGGLPNPDPEHTYRMVEAALEMQAFLKRWKAERQAEGRTFFEARIGIHTGPLIAGVVGAKKFAFDIWGDTVNVAARMESSSEAGRINISQATYERIQDRFPCSYRGKVPVKNLGEFDMYYVNANSSTDGSDAEMPAEGAEA
jgi:class 3 adenylate cyclase